MSSTPLFCRHDVCTNECNGSRFNYKSESSRCKHECEKNLHPCVERQCSRCVRLGTRMYVKEKRRTMDSCEYRCEHADENGLQCKYFLSSRYAQHRHEEALQKRHPKCGLHCPACERVRTFLGSVVSCCWPLLTSSIEIELNRSEYVIDAPKVRRAY